jgi:hypothetical protein
LIQRELTLADADYVWEIMHDEARKHMISSDTSQTQKSYHRESYNRTMEEETSTF